MHNMQTEKFHPYVSKAQVLPKRKCCQNANNAKTQMLPIRNAAKKKNIAKNKMMPKRRYIFHRQSYTV